MIRNILDRFLRTEQWSGLLLLLATIGAIGIANSPLEPVYHHLLSFEVGDAWGLGKSFHHWINDGLMAIFFLLAGLEIRREFTEGELSDLKKAFLPLAGAIGGMVVPAVVFLIITRATPEFWAGWAIPSATDIAFAIALLGLVSSRVPPSLRLFLLALAILDDIGAILVIALFYAGNLDSLALVAAGIIVAAMFMLRRVGVKHLMFYVIGGAALWLAVSHSGVHATLSGIILAFLLPNNRAVLQEWEEKLHPWTAYLILPLFAFANAGLSLAFDPGALFQPLPLGIFLGLLLGKQIGVMAGAFVAVRMGLAELPSAANWRHLHGVAILTGVGFTMSLFIGSLGFPAETQNLVRLGVLTGSLASALLGLFWLRYMAPKHQ